MTRVDRAQEGGEQETGSYTHVAAADDDTDGNVKKEDGKGIPTDR